MTTQPVPPACSACGNLDGNHYEAATATDLLNPVSARVVVVCGKCGHRDTKHDANLGKFFGELSSRP